MTISELSQEFVTQFRETTAIEAVAVFFGMLSVVLANRNHVWLYPTGIISTVIYIWLMASVKLYAESLLNLYYLIMSIYGWVLWNQHKKSNNPKAISHNTKQDWLITILISTIGWGVLYYVLSRYTNSDVPVWDAFVSATAWAGMWLLAKHKIENWILLNISNAIAIPLYIHKGIPFTSFLTLFLFIVAIFGYFRWKKLFATKQAL